MDLYNIETYLRPKSLREVQDWQPNWNWLAGGTWIFNEVQPQVKTLVDMQRLNWSEIEVTPGGLSIGATCIQNDLLDFSFPEAWTATGALKDAVRELASFKLSHAATVGGNICLALSASTFAPVMIALNASYEIWQPNGEPYFVNAIDFQTAPQQTILQPGEVLRRIKVPDGNLTQWQTSFKRMAVCTAGYAIAIIVTAYHPQTNRVRFGIGGSIKSPRLIEFDTVPTPEQIVSAIGAFSPQMYIDNERGSAAYRRHITQVLMQRGITELTTGIKGKRRY
ncbi:Molybdopterin dehydrogenase FAD-binding protein [Hyella patelloides LEGE 07179]|uniref:Molybdopterin dehydrogenase FAD-binding protein n=1 Tax=Hyella patelloides LEGE 07179 TaxID=945734 RepID=A0A563VLF5_9CYAN|nr:FAD binding domain-containing protein [Hyella patelloides]VEP12280.1 Molybdopterin dehydrogenase FAD-binding protein [Hyella patelloides LEGE 07179]